MFLEITEECYKKLKPYLDENNFKYETSDCTLPNDSVKHFHIEFGEMTLNMINDLALVVDDTYGMAAKESVLAEKAAINKEIDRPREKRVRKWDETGHTPMQETYGYMSGKSTEEEVVYQ